jgi:acyl dehydratase
VRVDYRGERKVEIKDYIGTCTGAGVIHVERGSVSRFAQALADDNPLYHDLRAANAGGFKAPPIPPTWTFAGNFLGARSEDQPQKINVGESGVLSKIIQQLMEGGGLLLHGEQEFHYHQPAQCGDVLHWESKITDIYTKESKGSSMTFIVTETVFRNDSGELVVTELFNLIHRG